MFFNKLIITSIIFSFSFSQAIDTCFYGKNVITQANNYTDGLPTRELWSMIRNWKNYIVHCPRWIELEFGMPYEINLE